MLKIMKLATQEQIPIKCCSKHTFKGARYIDGLYMVGFYKKEIQYNKLIYGGTSILDLSKLTMMKFQYNIIHHSFEGRYNLIYSDTDSIVYTIQHDNIYQWIKENKTHFDLSDTVREDLKDDENNKVIGKFIDETNSFPKTESVALNPKCYSFKHLKKDDTINNPKKSQRCFKILGKASDNA